MKQLEFDFIKDLPVIDDILKPTGDTYDDIYELSRSCLSCPDYGKGPCFCTVPNMISPTY